MSRTPPTPEQLRRLRGERSPTEEQDFYGMAMSKPRPRKADKPRDFGKAFERCVARGREIMNGGKPATDSDLVGLYAVLHEHVFSVLPLELRHDYGAACSSAGKLVRDEFGGDYGAAERFLAWCWKRFRASARRKIKEGEEPFRPGWRYQFKMRNLLTDYKAART